MKKRLWAGAGRVDLKASEECNAHIPDVSYKHCDIEIEAVLVTGDTGSVFVDVREGTKIHMSGVPAQCIGGVQGVVVRGSLLTVRLRNETAQRKMLGVAVLYTYETEARDV